MMSGVPSINEFAVATLEAANRSVKRATAGLTHEQLYFRPSADTNSIGWLLWHLSRWKDRNSAEMADEQQVWVSQGWHASFGIDAERTGFGDTLDQVAAFHVDENLLFGYVEAAHQATVERISRIPQDWFTRLINYAPGAEPRAAWRALVGTLMDATEHTGQIAYLRGLITGKGWLAS